MKRLFDIVFSLFLGIICFVPFASISIIVKLTSKGPILYWSDRVGKNNKIFKMPKFRTMKVDTPEVATHLLDGKSYVTPIGRILRKTSLDEIPQLWLILKGDMSFVGPRPALFNQDDLIELRTKYGIEKLIPGLTGWAQINGRDELSIPEKVELDRYYLENCSLLLDIKIMLLTLLRICGDRTVIH